MRPMSGYDVKKTIEGSIGNFWSESYGQIYPMLKGLVAEGLATRSVEAGDVGLERNVYALTDAGREELGRWLGMPVEHEVGRVEILLKLFFGWQVPAEENRRKVLEFRELHRGLLRKYGAIEGSLEAEHAGHPGLPYWLMTVRYGRRVSEALLDWCEETLAALDALDAATVTDEGAPEGAEARLSIGGGS